MKHKGLKHILPSYYKVSASKVLEYLNIFQMSNTIRIIKIQSATYIFNKTGKVHESPEGE